MKPFKSMQIPKQNILDKLLGLKKNDIGLIHINNILANKDIQEITPDEINEIKTTFNLNRSAHARKEFVNIFRSLLSHNLSDMKLSDSNQKDIMHLKMILGLKDEETEPEQQKIISEIYKSEVEKILVNLKMDSNDEKYIKTLKDNLLIDEDAAKDIIETSIKSKVNDISKEILDPEKYSPENEERFYSACEALKVNISLDENALSILDQNKYLWELRNGSIPIITVPINIQKSENCYYHTSCDWLENRKVTKRINYGGPTARIKLAKGIYYRAGSLAVKPTSEDVLMKIDSGDLYLTNKRLIFMGSKGNKTIGLNKILDFQSFSNGVDIQKDAGRSPFLQFNYKIEEFAIILNRLIKESYL